MEKLIKDALKNVVEIGDLLKVVNQIP